MNAYLAWILTEVLPNLAMQKLAAEHQHRAALDFERRARDRANQCANRLHHFEESITHLSQLAYMLGAVVDDVKRATETHTTEEK